MFGKEIETELFRIANNWEISEKKERLGAIIAWLPEKNAQGEIKAEIDWQLALIDVTENDIVYKKMADLQAKKNGLYFNFKLNGELVEYYEIPPEGHRPDWTVVE